MNKIKLYLKKWLFLYKNKSKHLKIGYRSHILNTQIGLYNTFYNDVIVANSKIDNFVYVGSGTKIYNAKIGKFCSIGPDCKITVGQHPTDFISTFPAFFSIRKQCQITFVDKSYFEEVKPIEIGNDVWIGANVIILDGIQIGNGAIIAAGAVVTKDVAPYEIVGGIPAKFIRKRFDEKQIDILLKFNWWDKEIIWLRKNQRYFVDTESFFQNIKEEF